MFKGSRRLTVAQACNYYLREDCLDDHPASEPLVETRGEWLGQDAERLGLKGSVRKADFVALLEGKSGESGSQLVESQRGTGKRRAAWDFTCSADKSVSIVALVGGDEALVDAHRKAARRGCSELERFVQVQHKKDRHRRQETTGAMVAAKFEHKVSRKADPQLHSHFVVMNMSLRSDGCWRALNELEMFGAVPLATAVYRAEMARLLRALGYAVVVRPAGSVGIDGLTQAQLDHFSRRRKEIEAYLLKHGLSGPKAATRAARTTREAKADHLDPSTLVASWKERAGNLGIDFRGLQKTCSEDRVVAPETLQAAARESVALALTHVSEMRAVFQERELEVAALHHGMGRMVVEEVRAAIAEQEGLIRMKDSGLPSDLLTTKDALRLEKRAIDLMRAGQDLGFDGRGSFRPTRGLNPDHERVVRFVLGGRDHVIGLRAREGTAKACALAALREAAEACGWTLRTLSPEDSASNRPPAIGITVATPSGELDAKPLPLELWIVDGAALLGSKSAVSILEGASQTGAKVVLVGDPLRCHAVEAGNPFAYLRQAGLKTHALYPSGRQQDAVLREVVARASEGRVPEAVAVLGDKGAILEIPSLKDRHQAIVQEVLKAPESLVIVAHADERTELNRLIREALIEAGRVERLGAPVPVAVSRALTMAQKGEARSYRIGDRLRFLDRWKQHQIAQGAEGRVLAVDPSRNRVTVQRRDGRVFEYDPLRFRSVEVLAVEEHRLAAGDRVQLGAVRKPRAARGEFGTIRSLDAGRVHILLDSGHRTTLRLGEGPLPLAHAYAIVSPGALGTTVDRVLLSVDASEPRELVNREQFLFSIATARRDVVIFTNSRANFAAAVSQEAPRGLDVDSIGRRDREGRSRNEGSRSEPGATRDDDGRHLPDIDAGRGNGGPRPGVERGGGEPRGPLPLADREGAAAPHDAGRAGEAARRPGRAGQEARGPGGPQRAATAGPLRTAERVSPARDGTDRGEGDRRARPGGSGGRAAARAGTAGCRGLEAGGGPRAEDPHGDGRDPGHASDRAAGIRALAFSKGARREPPPRFGSEPDRFRARSGKPSLPPLSGILERVRALERWDEERALRPSPAPKLERAPERDR